MKKNHTVGIIIPTLNPDHIFEENLKLLSSLNLKVLIIDSNSSINVNKIAKRYKANFVKENNFNHGSTREKARKMLKTDIVVYMTQDAKLQSSESIQNLIKPLIEGKASVSYGRQIPVKNAGILESFPVEFNYTEMSNVRSLNDIDKYGVGTFFCSDVFSAYINEDLNNVGGFDHVLTGEDYFMCYKILLDNKSVAYVSNACVIHSHNFSLIENFNRMFDTGYVRGERKHIQDLVGHPDSRGMQLTVSMFKKIIKEKPQILPYAILQTTLKYLGFKIGYYGTNLPVKVKRFLSGQKYFWFSSII